MKTHQTLRMLTRSVLVLSTFTTFYVVQLSTALAQGTAFTYQGQLVDGGFYANGFYDLEFTLYNDAVSGSALGVLTNTATEVADGLFTVSLDFGSGVFDGSDLWLEIGAMTNGGGAFSILSPRQAITATPYALLSAGVSGSVSASQLTGSISASNIGADSITSVMLADGAVGTDQLAAGSVFSGSFVGDGMGVTNVPGTIPSLIVTDSSVSAQPNTAYAVTNSELTTVTLPSDASIGDVVQVSGLGSGDWQVEPDSGQIISGYEAGLVWYPQETNRDWEAVASSADGNKLAAVVSGGQIYTSTDGGFNWSPHESIRYWTSIASSADGSKLVAADEGVFGGLIYTSIDGGSNWTPRETSRNWQSVASSADGSKLVAAVYNGLLYTSSNGGTNWVPRESSRYWSAVASSSDGTRLVAVDQGWLFSPGGYIYTSSNSGTNWIARESSRDWSSVASSADGNKLVATVGGGGFGRIYTSSDGGINWNVHESLRKWQSVASSADGSRLAAVSYGGQIYISSDSGISWSAHAVNRNWRSIASSSDGSKLVAVVDGGRIYTSSSALVGTAGSTVELQYAGNGVWQPISLPESSDDGPYTAVSRDENGDFAGGIITASAFVGSGSGLTSLNASQLTTGTVDDTRLSANVAKLNTSQTFTGANTFNSAGNSFTGNGAGLTGLPNGHSLDASDGSPANALYVDADGDVGIGTTTPSGDLQIQTPNSVNASFRMRSGTGWYLILNQSPSSVFSISNGGQDRLTIEPGGDIGIGTANPTEKLHVVGNIYATGTITPSSDRNLKKNFNPVNALEVLERVSSLPIHQWTYKAEADAVRHVGPMAQDFHAAFGYGANDVTIATVDADGVALAAIQGLNQKLTDELQRRDTENAELKARLTALEIIIANLHTEGN